MGKIYSKEYIKNLIENAGYTIIGEIGHLKDKVDCLTPDGYKVLVTPVGIRNRGDVPDIVSQFNPYSIENIQKWINNHGSQSILLSKEYINSKTKMLLRCECGTEFEVNWSDIYAGKKYCNYCAKSKRFDDLVDYNDLVAKECEKRGFILLPNQDIKRNSTRFQYICKKHEEYGIQESYPNNFVTNYGTGGCYYCGIEKRSQSKSFSDEECKRITEEKGFEYIEVRSFGKNVKRKIYYKCKKCKSNTIWSTSITNMVRSLGKCPGCKSSTFEDEINDILKKHNISFEREKKYDDCRDKYPLPFDFYLTDYNIIIEADGEQHYFPVFGTTQEEKEMNFNKTTLHDKIKNQYCYENNIALIRIPYWNRNNMEELILNKINTII